MLNIILNIHVSIFLLLRGAVEILLEAQRKIFHIEYSCKHFSSLKGCSRDTFGGPKENFSYLF